MFTITDIKKFKTIHKLAGKAIPKKSTMPILNHCRFFTTDQGAYIRATDLSTCATIDISDSIEYAAPFDFLVPFKPLTEALRKQKSGFSISAMPGNAVKIGALTTFTLSTEEFPIMPEISAFRLPLVNVAGAIKKILYAAGETDARYMLNGLLFDFKSRKYVATDGHRMACADMERSGMPLPVAGMPDQAIIARKTAELMELLPGNPFVAFDKGRAIFEYSTIAGSTVNASVFTRLIEGKYPDYKQVIDAIKKTASMVFNRAEMLQALETVSGVLDRSRRAVSLYFRDGNAVVFASNNDTGTARATIPATYDGEFCNTYTFNIDYLRDILTASAGDIITINFGPEIFSPVSVLDGSDVSTVLMPMSRNDVMAPEDALYMTFPEHIKAAMRASIEQQRIARRAEKAKGRKSWADYAETLIYSGAFRKALKVYKRMGAMMQYRELLACLPDFERMTAPATVQG